MRSARTIHHHAATSKCFNVGTGVGRQTRPQRGEAHDLETGCERSALGCLCLLRGEMPSFTAREHPISQSTPFLDAKAAGWRRFREQQPRKPERQPRRPVPQRELLGSEHGNGRYAFGIGLCRKANEFGLFRKANGIGIGVAVCGGIGGIACGRRCRSKDELRPERDRRR